MKVTRITVDPGAGRTISAAVLFAHLRSALEGHDIRGDTTIVIAADGSVELERGGQVETIYKPKRLPKKG